MSARQDPPSPDDNPHPEQFDAALAALGRLSPAEQAAFEAHALGCAVCQQEMADFGELAGRLAVVPVDVVDSIEDPELEVPPDLTVVRGDTVAPSGLLAAVAAIDDRDAGERALSQQRQLESVGPESLEILLGRARRSSQRRRRTTVAASFVGAAAAAVVGFVAAGTFSQPQQLKVTVALAAGPAAPHADGSMTLTDTTEGTHLSLAADGLPEGEHCTLVLITPDHKRTVVLTWTANYEGEAVLTAPSPIAASQADAVSVVDDSGKTLLQGALRS